MIKANKTLPEFRQQIKNIKKHAVGFVEATLQRCFIKNCSDKFCKMYMKTTAPESLFKTVS